MLVRQDLAAGEWQLVITDVRWSDAGQYECQVNTSPTLAHTINLAVVGTWHFVICSAADDPSVKLKLYNHGEGPY